MTTRTKRQALPKERNGRDGRRPVRPSGDLAPVPGRRPFDGTELARVPRPRDDDPPYRSWWVIDGNAFDDPR
jgi:hypothetical protein